MEAKVETYKSKKEMQSSIEKRQKAGWAVVSVQPLDRGRSWAKTGCLGLIFLPLALLGKRKAGFLVAYQRQEPA